MNIFYLSTSAFSDNQISILHQFKKDYRITYGVIFPNKNSNYTSEELDDYCRQHDIEFMPFNLQYRFRDPRNLAAYYKIVSVIKRRNPDVILVANFDQIYLNMLLLLLDRSKTIIAMHDVENHSRTAFERLTMLAKTVLLKHFSYFLTYSKHQAQVLKQNFKDKKVYTIPLPLIGFGPIQDRKKDENFTTFLFFGNILYYKGLDILLEAVTRLSKRYSNFKLIVAGRSNDWEEVYAPLISDQKNIETHIGFIGNDQIADYFAQADYLVLPYRDTTQSGPLMIAYNYNVPVIASDAPGFNEFFMDGVSGYQYNQSLPNHIDLVLAMAIERSNDEYYALKTRMAKLIEDKYSAQKLCTAYETMFEAIDPGMTLTKKYESTSAVNLS